MKNAILAIIPFNGFYYSDHSHTLNHALEQLTQDSSGCANEKVVPLLFDCVDWTKVYQEYTKLYVENFVDFMGINMDLDSPKFYNYSNDRIFVNIAATNIKKIFRKTDKTILTKIAADRHTSYSGFHSFYSPEWKSWGAVLTWEPEQLHTLIQAYCETINEGDYGEYLNTIMEDADCNGELDNILCGNLNEEGKRLLRITDYLRNREERKYLNEEGNRSLISL